MSPEERYYSLKDDIHSRVSALLNSYNNDHVSKLQSADDAIQKIHDFSGKSGKRIRGVLAVVAYQSYGGKDTQVALDMAACIELYHDYLLIIDDVMDRSSVRRGAPTVHEAYRTTLHGISNDNVSYQANMLAVTTGLAVQHVASSVMSGLNAPPELVMRCIQVVQDNLYVTCFGQIEDVTNELLSEISEEAILEMYALKSGYYTFSNPLLAGAALAGANYNALRLDIERFGRAAGIAFQLRDDLIGIFGDTQATGKLNYDDIKEGKATVLVSRTLQELQLSDREILSKILGDRTLDSGMYHKAIALINQTDAIDYVQQMIAEYSADASNILENSNLNSELRVFLEYVLTFGMSRKS